MSENVDDPQFERLLEHVKRTRGFDFTGYKRPSLMRRVKKRMADVSVKNYVDYINYLDAHPTEFAELFNTVLINVTAFFRDPDAWQYLAETVIPQMIANSGTDLRVWSAGCASGEEAYSIAMLLCEALGPQEFRMRVKIYATDIDEHALMQARHATYTARDLDAVPMELREKYFLLSNSQYTFRPDLRRSVIFGRHDLVQDAPISRLDLLVCRNTLMYMNADTQARILTRMHFALKEQGFLFLGKAEMLIAHSELFNPVDLRYRIFVKALKTAARERFLMAAGPVEAAAGPPPVKHARLAQLSFNASSVPQLVIDLDGNLRLANELARRLFGIRAEELGRPLQDLDVSYRPVELRSLAKQALADLRAVRLNNIPFKRGSNLERYLDVQVLPLLRDGGKPMGVSVCFTDATDFHELCESLKASHEELETTNEELQATNEELETTNEELQSTNEELQTTNEELQSTHEELETTNEELQSTHEELQATNEELTALTSDKEASNTFLASILSSMPGGVIVIDKEWKVRAWNKESEEMWGPRADEVSGQPFFELDIGLPAADLRVPIAEISHYGASHKTLNIDTIDRRGKPLALKVTITPIVSSSSKREGVVLVLYRKQTQ